MTTLVNGQGAAVAEAAITEFGSRLHGELVVPSDGPYDKVRRVWNGMIDRRPELIARCVDADDVARSVAFARDHELLVAIRGGGHSLPGLSVCEGGLLVDLSPMKAIAVDLERRTALVQSGALWGELDRHTHTFGLAVTGGMVSHTGVAGLTLGGGLGWLMRRYGLVCDNLLSAEVVTADGRRVTAAADENPDLFWGLRGGGGNFGVVTSFKYQLHSLHTVFAGLIAYPLAEAPRVLCHFREWAASTPDELTTTVAFLTSAEGHRAVGVGICYAGDLGAGEEVANSLRKLGTVVVDQVGPMPYPAVQSMLDHLAEPGNRYYVRSNFTDGISDDLVGAVSEQYAQVPSPLSLVLMFQLGGAVGRVPVEATAFTHRDASWSFEIFSGWTAPEDDDRNVAWLRDTWNLVQPSLGRGGVYVNALDRGEGSDRVKEAYGPAYDRLAALKAKYDPANVFRLNQNIKPAG